MPREKQAIDSFLEELVVRRELSDNFCHYNDKHAICPPPRPAPAFLPPPPLRRRRGLGCVSPR